MMVGPEVRKYSGHPPWGSQGELQTCRAFIALLEQKRPDINQRVNLFSDFLEVTILHFFILVPPSLFIKVRIFWTGKKDLKQSPTLFDIYEVNIKSCGRLFQILWPS